MAIPWGSTNRCPASSWRGQGEAPGRNRCIYTKDRPHDLHRDECGNTFNDDKDVVTINKVYPAP